MQKFTHTPRPTYSLWGQVDQAEEIMAGVWQVSTPSHGGIILSAQRLEFVPRAYLDASFGRNGWQGNFEEDCDMAIPLCVFEYEYRQYLAAKGVTEEKINENMILAHQTLNDWILPKVVGSN